MLKIKLFPTGKKHQRSFRIVIAPDRSKANGEVVDTIGFFTPQTKTLTLDRAKFDLWTKRGAKPTAGVNKLISSTSK